MFFLWIECKSGWDMCCFWFSSCEWDFFLKEKVRGDLRPSDVQDLMAVKRPRLANFGVILTHLGSVDYLSRWPWPKDLAQRIFEGSFFAPRWSRWIVCVFCWSVCGSISCFVLIQLTYSWFSCNGIFRMITGCDHLLHSGKVWRTATAAGFAERFTQVPEVHPWCS